MKELILLIGAPASGKSTYCQNNLQDYSRVSQDEMGREGHLNEFTRLVNEGKNIVVDRMNFNKQQRAKYISRIADKEYIVKVIHLNTPKDVCVARAKVRVNHPTLSPEKSGEVINFFFNSFEAPEFSEGIHEISNVLVSKDK